MRFDLRIRWGVSRGRDTYGYNICTLFVNGVKVASCNGGGYDMVGTVLGEWMMETFQQRLTQLSRKFYGLRFVRPDRKDSGTEVPDKDHTIAVLDGACGDSCMREVLKAIGGQYEEVKGSKGLQAMVWMAEQFDVAKMERLVAQLDAQMDEQSKADVGYENRRLTVAVPVSDDEREYIINRYKYRMGDAEKNITFGVPATV